MGKLFVVVGNSGIGKTTLVNALYATNNFVTGLEEHVEHPFQELFKTNPQYALANQVDYLLVRARQERFIRQGNKPGIQDGGLDMDFYVFTRLFQHKGYLSGQEFSLCERVYAQVRTAQPPPEKIIWMHAPLEVIANRFTGRKRPLEITEREDLEAIESLLLDWLLSLEPKNVIHLDASKDDPTYLCLLPALQVQLSDPASGNNPDVD